MNATMKPTGRFETPSRAVASARPVTPAAQPTVVWFARAVVRMVRAAVAAAPPPVTPFQEAMEEQFARDNAMRGTNEREWMKYE